MLKWLRGISLAAVMGWVVLAFTWASVLFLAFGTWWEVRVGRGGWTISEAFAAMKDDWVWLTVVSIACLFVFWNPGRRILDAANRQNLESDCANYLTVALEELNRLVKRRSQKDDMRSVWEPLLVSAQLDVERELGLQRDRVKTNLLLLTQDEKVCVVARSRPGSALNITYALDLNTPTARAIRTNKTHIASNISHPEPRPYKSVAATPIATGQRVCGVITADSVGRRDFKGKEVLIDAILRPYCSLIALAADDKMQWKPCPARYDR